MVGVATPGSWALVIYWTNMAKGGRGRELYLLIGNAMLGVFVGERKGCQGEPSRSG